jgi:uncharacterized protein (DUF488 family)
MQTEEFARNLETLISLAQPPETLAFMCAEAVPWRCHRSLIADALTVRDYSIEDILSLTSSQPHRMTPFARIEGTQVTYPKS